MCKTIRQAVDAYSFKYKLCFEMNIMIVQNQYMKQM